MTLSTGQNTKIDTYVKATPELADQDNDPDGNTKVAELLNLDADPLFLVWKTSVMLQEVMDNIDGLEFDLLTPENIDKLKAFAAYHPDNTTKLPNQADKRAFFEKIFGAGSTTITNLNVLYRRPASEAERVLATTIGDGTNETPATLDFDGSITRPDIEAVRKKG